MGFRGRIRYSGESQRGIANIKRGKAGDPARLDAKGEIMLSSRWIPSRYSDRIYHLTLKNYRDGKRDIVAEMELDHGGNVWPSLRFAGEELTVGEGSHYPDLESCSQAILRRIQKLFINRRNGLVMEFQPLWRQEDIANMYCISTAAAHYWRSGRKGGKRYLMSEGKINQVLANIGFIFGGRGGGVVGIREPVWDEKTVDNG